MLLTWCRLRGTDVSGSTGERKSANGSHEAAHLFSQYVCATSDSFAPPNVKTKEIQKKTPPKSPRYSFQTAQSTLPTARVSSSISLRAGFSFSSSSSLSSESSSASLAELASETGVDSVTSSARALFLGLMGLLSASIVSSSSSRPLYPPDSRKACDEPSNLTRPFSSETYERVS
jgi:hypothetical protein